MVGEAAEMSSLLLQAKESNHDVVLLDWELAHLRISDLLPVLKQLHPGLRVVALSGRPEAAKAALAAGADAFVSKGDQPERLVSTLRDIKEKISS
ncbi:MAG: response regulator [Peptococcaceae bacterium]|nr:response regulator [Peptococcaceae bacterium]